MLDKQTFDNMKVALNTFKNTHLSKYNTLIKYFDIWVLLLSIAKKESNYNCFVQGKDKDYGLFQIIPATLDGIIKGYQKDVKKIETIKQNFYSKDKKTAVTTQTYIMLHLAYDYAVFLEKRPVQGYYKDFLETIVDKDLKNITIGYLQHGGGNAIFTGTVTTQYELISTLALDILHIAKDIYKTLYDVDKEITFDMSKFEKNAMTAGILKQVQAAYNGGVL